jgi:hypothetical protein
MRISVNQRGYTLSGLSTHEINVVMFLLGQLKDQCFHDSDHYNEESHAGGGFTASLKLNEREDLRDFVDGFWREYDKLRARLRQTGRR